LGHSTTKTSESTNFCYLLLMLRRTKQCPFLLNKVRWAVICIYSVLQQPITWNWQSFKGITHNGKAHLTLLWQSQCGYINSYAFRLDNNVSKTVQIGCDAII
jgi:hypothetical protein